MRQRNSKLLHIGNILYDIVRQLDLQEPFTIEAIRNSWQNIAGDAIAASSEPFEIVNDTLYIRSNHSVISNEIVMMKTAILNRIKEKFGIEFKNIKMRLK